MVRKMDDIYYMTVALDLARLSASEGEVPVGAVVVKDGIIVGKGRNKRELSKNAIAHAEIEAINDACKTLGGWRLWECDIYVTLEPCPMCAGAIINSRIKRLIYGADDIRFGAVSSVLNLFDYPFNHKPEITRGILKDECKKELSDFFKKLRN